MAERVNPAMARHQEPGVEHRVDHVPAHPSGQQLAARHAAALSLGDRRDPLIARARNRHKIPLSQHPDKERCCGLLRATQSTALRSGADSLVFWVVVKAGHIDTEGRKRPKTTPLNAGFPQFRNTGGPRDGRRASPATARR
ncbi:MAG: hypothetical protein ACJ76X_19415 [Solirubrobacteraceae bacterium]